VGKQPLCSESANLSTSEARDTQSISHLAHPRAKRRCTHEDRTARSGGCALASAEAQNRNVSDASQPYTLQSPARTLCGILDDRNSMVSRQLLHGTDVGWISVKVAHNYCIDAAVDRLLD
jgi:hypothetical protein